MKSFDLVLVRHGESQWNKENRFTGWVDVDLSEKGVGEACAAGQVLRTEGFEFDRAYTSILKRAIRTLWLALDEMDSMYLPIMTSWRLNERHYGGLQGLNKSETAAKYGEDQVKIWRRSYDTPPPDLSDKDFEAQSRERRFRTVPQELLPRGETLKTTCDRLLPYWREELWPVIQSGQRCLIVAHGNSLRALVQHLDGLSADAIMEVNIPTGIPLLYKLNTDMKVLEKRYLGDPDAVAAAIHSVAKQGQKR